MSEESKQQAIQSIENKIHQHEQDIERSKILINIYKRKILKIKKD